MLKTRNVQHFIELMVYIIGFAIIWMKHLKNSYLINMFYLITSYVIFNIISNTLINIKNLIRMLFDFRK